jgi:tRNA pseudouridine38-40 synthase
VARYSWQVWPALELAAMQAASAALVGRHDFASFGSDPEHGDSTVRTVVRAEWRAAPGGWFYFDIQAEAFLFRMVRSLVGALKRVGQGEMTAQDFIGLLAARDRAQCPAIAPPQGLCLMEVLY